MKLTHLKEPALEFGGDLRHQDIRFGIMDYGPFDLGMEGAPKRIKLGIGAAPRRWRVPRGGSRDARSDSPPRTAGSLISFRRSRG